MTSTARDPCTRCPDCGFIAPPESMDYGLAPDRSIDWTRPARVTCPCCHASYHIRAGDVLPVDDEMTCRRCGTPAACPAWAARVRCPGCGLFLLGPGLDSSQRGELRIAEGLAGLALRETCKAAGPRPRRRPGRRPWHQFSRGFLGGGPLPADQ